METLLNKLTKAQIKRRLQLIESQYLSTDEYDREARLEILDEWTFYRQLLREKRSREVL